MSASSSSVIPTPLAHADNQGEGHPRGHPHKVTSSEIKAVRRMGLVLSTKSCHHRVIQKQNAKSEKRGLLLPSRLFQIRQGVTSPHSMYSMY
ncbi:hypothetical protein TNCV_1021891 [Trichonephila clavipes]|nr:hypothetical protein TNCV_1021891 [Trichonephila clavipes]